MTARVDIVCIMQIRIYNLCQIMTRVHILEIILLNNLNTESVLDVTQPVKMQIIFLPQLFLEFNTFIPTLFVQKIVSVY